MTGLWARYYVVRERRSDPVVRTLEVGKRNHVYGAVFHLRRTRYPVGGKSKGGGVEAELALLKSCIETVSLEFFQIILSYQTDRNPSATAAHEWNEKIQITKQVNYNQRRVLQWIQ